MISKYTDGITWWQQKALDGYGQLGFKEPIFLWSRWEDKQELFIDDKGEKVLSKSVVYVHWKNEIKCQDYLYHGKTSLPNPRSILGAFRIKAVCKIPNFKNTKQILTLWM